jgi:hypothetical protein
MMEMTLVVLFMVFSIVVIAVIALVIVAQNDEVSKQGMNTLRSVAHDMFLMLSHKKEQEKLLPIGESDELPSEIQSDDRSRAEQVPLS